jgi:hypothetical protein
MTVHEQHLRDAAAEDIVEGSRWYPSREARFARLASQSYQTHPGLRHGREKFQDPLPARKVFAGSSKRQTAPSMSGLSGSPYGQVSGLGGCSKTTSRAAHRLHRCAMAQEWTPSLPRTARVSSRAAGV